MRLKTIERGATLMHRARRALYRIRRGHRMPDIDRALSHRELFFGRPLVDYCGSSLRYESRWSIGERELFATFVAKRNECSFCTTLHRAFALQAFPEDVVDAALADWRTAPLDVRMRATLGFLEKLTLTPAEICADDVQAVREAGVSDRDLEDAIHVCAAFNVIVRVANSLDFVVPSSRDILDRAEVYAGRVRSIEEEQREAKAAAHGPTS